MNEEFETKYFCNSAEVGYICYKMYSTTNILTISISLMFSSYFLCNRNGRL